MGKAWTSLSYDRMAVVDNRSSAYLLESDQSCRSQATGQSWLNEGEREE